MRCKTLEDYEFCIQQDCMICEDEKSCKYSRANDKPMMGMIIVWVLFLIVVIGVCSVVF